MLIYLPGNYAKIQIDGETVIRAHALTDGTWVGRRIGELSPDRTFADESAALAWITLAAVTL